MFPNLAKKHKLNVKRICLLNQQCVHLIVNNSEPTLNSGVYEGRSDRGPLIQEIIIPDGQNFESQVGCLLRISNIPARYYRVGLGRKC